MRLLLLSSGLVSVAAWVSLSPLRAIQPHRLQQKASVDKIQRQRQLYASPSPNQQQPTDFLKDNNLDFILTEQPRDQQGENVVHRRSSRHRIVIPSHEHDQRTTILASTSYRPAPIQETEETTGAEEGESLESVAEDGEADPYASAFDDQMEKIQTITEQVQQANQEGGGLGARLKNMDLTDIISTLLIPSIALFAAGRWAFNRVSRRLAENADNVIDSFSREMIYHDGDFDEMKLCYQDYSRKLMFLGPSRTDTMLKAYLEAFAKKKTVSPQAIVSLSYVFKLAKLSEERAAQVLVSLCKRMGAEKVSSSGKLLFLGSRILKSPEGQKALEPIKDLIKGTYRDATVAETLVETSQQAIAEASYRAAVQAAGKNQKKLTLGWETLGLDRTTAERIFDEEAEEGFISDREAMYGGQTQKYDKKGRRVNKDGSLEDPAEAAEAAKEEEEEESVSNVYECSECGYTLFVAQGRETKFYGNDFKCPQCGAPKDRFVARDDFGED